MRIEGLKKYRGRNHRVYFGEAMQNYFGAQSFSVG
jgi:hypothetical protein